jgi:hypothetical protein
MIELEMRRNIGLVSEAMGEEEKVKIFLSRFFCEKRA